MRSKFIRKKSVVEVFGNNTMSNPYASIGGVGYSFVKEIIKSNDTNQGWTVSEFNNTSPYTTQESVRVDPPLNGKLIKTTFYLNDNTIKKEVKYKYLLNTTHLYFGINFKRNINAFTHVFSTGRESFTNPDLGDSFYANKAFTIIAHRLQTYDILLESITTTTDNVIETEKNSYNPVTLQLKEKKISKSNSADVFSHKYLYPNDLNCGIYATMLTKNILSPIVEEQLFNDGKYIGGSMMEYKVTDYNLIAPSKKYFSELKNPLSSAPTYSCTNGVSASVFPFVNVKYEKFDRRNNPAYLIHNDATKIVYIWGYNYQYPIAKIENATYAEVETAIKTVFSVTNIDVLSAQNTPNETKLKDGNLQKALPNALVTTYTYRPLVGMTSVTDPRGVKTTYEYDPFGRLQTIKDENNKAIENYDYHYNN